MLIRLVSLAELVYARSTLPGYGWERIRREARLLWSTMTLLGFSSTDFAEGAGATSFLVLSSLALAFASISSTPSTNKQIRSSSAPIPSS